jgi:penicillin-binding protein 1B
MTSHATSPATAGVRARAPRLWRRWWVKPALLVLAVPALMVAGFLGYYYVAFSRMMDARLQADLDRPPPRVFARPFELSRGLGVTQRQLVDRLNDLGYASRTRAERPGEFTETRDGVTVIPRGGDHAGRTVRAVFGRPQGRREPMGIQRLEVLPGRRATERIRLEAPLVTVLVQTGREKRRRVPLDQIPRRVVEAVLAIEDRRFYDHPGVDPIAAFGALITNITGDRPYLVGGSTITQQIVKNTFLTPEQTLRRKVLEQFMALILERRLTKDEILDLYLNDVYLGHRGSFAIHGVAEGARLFFG